jgi:hypothetical protein
MSAIKHEFHEVLSGESGSIEALKIANDAAWARVFHLIDTLPVWRTSKQQAELDKAESDAEWAKWRLDRARRWPSVH